MRYEIDIEESEGKWVVIVSIIKYTESVLTVMAVPYSFQVFNTEKEAKEAKNALKKLLI